MSEPLEDAVQAGQESKHKLMTQAPIPGLVCRMAVPTIISMLTTSFYNMADTYFVSQIGTSASGAVGVVFSLMALIQACGFTLGVGSGSVVARLLGAKERQRASEVAATAFGLALGVGLLFTVFGLTFIGPLMRLLGATETIFPYARDYAQYILIGAPYMAGTFVLNLLLRYQGSAFFSMVGIASGGVLNIILDPIFIFTFGLGTGGAALATIISQFVSFCILFFNSLGRNGNLKIDMRNFRFDIKMIGAMLAAGMPTFSRQSLASLSTVFLNVCAAPFGDAAIAAMSIVNRVMMFVNSSMLGFGQGFQPVCGFNFGAKRFDRVIKAFRFTVTVASPYAVVGAAMFFGASWFITQFRREDAEVIAIGTLALQVQCATLPFRAWTTIVNMYAQSSGRNLRALVLAMGRQGLFFFPFILTLPYLIGLLGVQLAQGCAEMFSFLLAFPIGISLLRQDTALMRAQEGCGDGKKGRPKIFKSKGRRINPPPFCTRYYMNPSKTGMMREKSGLFSFLEKFFARKRGIDAQLCGLRSFCWIGTTRMRAAAWREDTSPYRVWVSEIMLQQTRVEPLFRILNGLSANSRTLSRWRYAG
jgi:putative MATE family efflux protein